MLDAKYFRQEIEFAAEKLKIRGIDLDIKNINQLEAERKRLQTNVQELQNKRNQLSKSIGQAKAKGESVDAIMQQVGQVGDELVKAEKELISIQEQLQKNYRDYS